ncbi:hypothetical protein FRC00_003512 [Tulasnella sp. 408]|nr:hypothetical protein FRC00_003512 [Tulasnella sp. 408]
MAYPSPCNLRLIDASNCTSFTIDTRIRTSFTGAKAPQLNAVEGSNGRHNHAGGEASGATGGLQCKDSLPSMNVYGDNDAGNETSSSYALPAATPIQQYAPPQQAYDSQHYAHQYGHQNQQQLVKIEVRSPFHHQFEQQPSYGMAHPNTSSALGHHQQQQRHQNPQYLLPPPPSFRQPSLPLLPAHPDGTIPHYTFGASPLNESDHAAPKVGQTRCLGALSRKRLRLARGLSRYPSHLMFSFAAK